MRYCKGISTVLFCIFLFLCFCCCVLCLFVLCCFFDVITISHIQTAHRNIEYNECIKSISMGNSISDEIEHIYQLENNFMSDHELFRGPLLRYFETFWILFLSNLSQPSKQKESPCSHYCQLFLRILNLSAKKFFFIQLHIKKISTRLVMYLTSLQTT